jgi:hypothetical protein
VDIFARGHPPQSGVAPVSELYFHGHELALGYFSGEMLPPRRLGFARGSHSQRVPRRWGDTTHKPATTMTPKQSDANQRSESPVALKINGETSFAFAVERAIVKTKIFFKLYRGLCGERERERERERESILWRTERETSLWPLHR